MDLDRCGASMTKVSPSLPLGFWNNTESTAGKRKFGNTPRASLGGSWPLAAKSESELLQESGGGAFKAR